MNHSHGTMPTFDVHNLIWNIDPRSQFSVLHTASVNIAQVPYADACKRM